MYKRLIITTIVILLFAANPLRSQIVIEMEKQGNLFAIPCKINGLPIKLLFDTGASGVSISLTEAMFMYKNGYLSDNDIGGTVYVQTANGDIVEDMEIVIREIEIGGLKITNIKATVSNTLNAPLLLGQSAIQKLGPIQLDGNKLIVLTENNANIYQDALSYYGLSFEQNEAGLYSDAIASAKKGLTLTNDLELRMGLYDEIAAAYSGLGMLDSSITARRMALASFPNMTTAYNLGYALYEQQQFDDAYRAFERCIHLEQPGAVEKKDVLGAAYAYLADIDYMNGRLYDAERYAKKSITYNQTPMAFFTLGHVFQDKKDYAMSIHYYEQGIRFEPNRPSNAKYYGTLGFLYSMNDSSVLDLKKAIENFDKCIEIYNDYHKQIVSAGLESEKIDAEQKRWAYISAISSAHIFYWEGYSRLALKYIRKAVSLHDGTLERPDEYFIWANSEIDQDQIEKVTKDGLELFPDDPDLLFQRALVIEADNRETAIKIYKKIITINKNNPLKFFDIGTLYNNIAWCYFLLEQPTIGLPYSEKSIELNPNHDYSWETLGEIQFALGRYQECINAFEHCIAISDKYKKTSYEFMGKAKIALGKSRDGKKDLEKARDITE